MCLCKRHITQSPDTFIRTLKQTYWIQKWGRLISRVSRLRKADPAFITPWGLRQWARVPFGLTNAPAGLQRYMKGFWETSGMKFVSHIWMMLQLQLQATHPKCEESATATEKMWHQTEATEVWFYKRDVYYVGRVVSSEGHKMNPKEAEDETWDTIDHERGEKVVGFP